MIKTSQHTFFLDPFVFVALRSGHWTGVACLNLSNCTKLPAIKTSRKRKKENVSQDEAPNHQEGDPWL